MRTIKSSRKPSRPSIDNPRLVTRMKSSAVPKRPTLRPALIAEELGESGVRTRRRAKLYEDAVSASNVGKAASSAKTSESQSLSISWMDSLRSFKVRGPREASTSRSVSSRKSPRNNSSISTSTLRSNNSFVNLASGKNVEPSSKSSNTPIQSFKFKPTNISEIGFPKKQTPMLKLKAPTPTVIAFGSSFSCQTPTDLSNNNLNTPKLNPRTREGVRKLNGSLNVSANGGKSSPKNSSKQRGVLLPLLREKDTLIRQLEETISTFQDKSNACDCESMHQLREENVNLKRERVELEDKLNTLSVDKISLQEEVDDYQAKIFDVETKNMSLIKNLESEQAHVESLQAKMIQVRNADNKHTLTSSGDSEADMERLIETFIERLGVLCRDQSLKMSISSRNVKLSIKTRAELPSSRETTLSSSTERLESTHLCETEVSVRKPRCRSFRQFAALQDDEAEVEVIKSPQKKDKSDKPKKNNKASGRPKSKEYNKSDVIISPTMGEKMGKLRLNENDHPDMSETRLTRSMAKNRSVSMTNVTRKMK